MRSMGIELFISLLKISYVFIWKGEFTFDTAPPLGSDVEHGVCVSTFVIRVISSTHFLNPFIAAFFSALS